MTKHGLNKTMLAASGILVAASVACAKTPSPDSGSPSNTVTTVEATARNKKHKPAASQATDTIEVVGHMPLAGGPVTHFVCTRHYSSDYLYAERAAGEDITLIDVTKAEQPSILANVREAPSSDSEALVAVAGTAALVSTEQPADATATTPQTLKIMDFSDPQHPKVARQFNGVTAVGRDDERGLVFVANGEGIWILQRHLADDPKVDEEYAHYVLYNP